jgi:5'-nucleotidase
MTGKTRVLITNDDGIASEGIRQLAVVALAVGLDVVVAAPDRESSGCSAGLTAIEDGGRVIVERRELDGLEGADVYAVAALPAFIAMIGTRGAFGRPPDVILSGINKGPNTGHAVLHSGTVGAALTAVSNGTPAMAFSLDVGPVWHWETAAEVAAAALPLILHAREPVVLNVNVPNVEPAQLAGFKQATLAEFGAVQTGISEIGHGFVRVTVTDVDAKIEPGTDVAYLRERYATVTPLQAVCEAPLRLRQMSVPRRDQALVP